MFGAALLHLIDMYGFHPSPLRVPLPCPIFLTTSNAPITRAHAFLRPLPPFHRLLTRSSPYFLFPFFSIRYNLFYSYFHLHERVFSVFNESRCCWNRKTASSHWQPAQKVTQLASRCSWNLIGWTSSPASTVNAWMETRTREFVVLSMPELWYHRSLFQVVSVFEGLLPSEYSTFSWTNWILGWASYSTHSGRETKIQTFFWSSLYATWSQVFRNVTCCTNQSFRIDSCLFQWHQMFFKIEMHFCLWNSTCTLAK